MRITTKQVAKASVAVYEKSLPVVYITQEVMSKMQIIIDKVSDEVGWLMEVKRPDDKTFLIDEIYLPIQDVHGATTEINTPGLTQLSMDLLELPDGMERWNRIRAWGHSHVNMAPNPSSQDKTQMDLFIANGCEFFIRIIANKKGVMKLDLFDYVKGVEYKDLSWETLYYKECEDIANQIDKLENKMSEIEAKKEKSFSLDIDLLIKNNVKKIVSTTGTRNYGESVRVYSKELGRYAYPAEIRAYNSRKKKETEKEKTQSGKWYPTTFDELNQVFTEDEVIEIALEANSVSQTNIIIGILPGAPLSLITQIIRLSDDYWHDSQDEYVRKAMTRKV